MIKAIFLDVDGTLVSFDNHKVPRSTFEFLVKAREKGVKINTKEKSEILR